MNISATSVGGNSPAPSCFRKAYESKWMDAALIISILACSVITYLAARGHFDYMGTTNAACIRYTTAVINITLVIIESKRVINRINCFNQPTILRPQSQQQDSLTEDQRQRLASHYEYKSKSRALSNKYKYLYNENDFVNPLKFPSINVPISEKKSEKLSDVEVAKIRLELNRYIETDYQSLIPCSFYTEKLLAKETWFNEESLKYSKQSMNHFLDWIAAQEDPVDYVLTEFHNLKIHPEILDFFKNALKEIRPFPDDQPS